MDNPWHIYDLLIERAQSEALDAKVKQIIIGLTWTLCQYHSPRGTNAGLAMSPNQYTRTLTWSGSLIDQPIKEIVTWIKSWDPFEAAIGLSAINAVVNSSATSLATKANALTATNTPNLTVFDYFLPKLINKKVVIVGRYPGLERYEKLLNLHILERNPIDGDMPDPACEYVLPEADWVFLTANSIANKTFPRLAELSKNAVTVLMGPSVPWIQDWAEYGVDFLAGVQICNTESLKATISEGGGVRIFDRDVKYHIFDLSQKDMQDIKVNISDLVKKRELLKAEMSTWYDQCSNGKNKPRRFPKWTLLAKIDQELSILDLRYKRQWDARYSASQ